VIDHPLITDILNDGHVTASLVVVRDVWPVSVSVDWWRRSINQWEKLTLSLKFGYLST